MLTKQKVIAKLKEMADADQAVRTTEPRDYERMDKLAEENTSVMKQIVADKGWITVDEYGAEAAHNAWLLIQHAFSDMDFQEHCLELMRQLPEGEVDKKELAMLMDRVMVKKYGKQRYGSQVKVKDDYILVFPIEELEKLDELRASMGMNPMQEKLATLIEKWKRPAFFSEEEYEQSKTA